MRSFTDVHNGLIEDDLVDKDKIGGSNFFWSFPAKKDRMMQLQHQDRLKNIEKLKVELTEAQAKLADAKRGREDDVDGTRAQKLARLQEISSLMKPLHVELASLKENDPQALADLQQELKLCREAANRWTDNIFNAQSYLVKKRGFEKKAANKLLGITDSFDCRYFGTFLIILCEKVIELTCFSFSYFDCERPRGQNYQVIFFKV